ncbi:MAG: 2-oxoacid:acceptor oxidoreductase family protein [Chloroflexi bacterium]|nr:2-oxoacid:acceptor oxidoreductase family protein [Chloroflexota bacterium]
MLEIRFHGRGGQGAVTSAEMIALAAIAEGKYAQAFPSFGPERRGAPVLAFVRVSEDKPIKIRAGITKPDMVVVMDPSLARITDVTAGLKDDGTVVINTKRSAGEIQAVFGGKWPVVTVNASAIARELLGVNIVNTTMLGAMLRALPVVKTDSLEGPLNHRFGARARSNYQAALRAFKEAAVKEKSATPEKPKMQFTPERVLTWKEMLPGCAVTEPGSTAQYSTGDWRSQRPVWNHDLCIKCGICYLVCPQECISQDEQKWFGANLYHCYGCGTCSTECPTRAISMVEEGE